MYYQCTTKNKKYIKIDKNVKDKTHKNIKITTIHKIIKKIQMYILRLPPSPPNKNDIKIY